MIKFKYVWNYTGKTLNDLFRASRSTVTLASPTDPDQTVDLNLSACETVVDFTEPFTQSFNLNVIPRSCKKGDKLYLIMDGSATVTSVGALNFNNCGPDSPPSEHEVDGKTIIPLMFDGEMFYGLDYC